MTFPTLNSVSLNEQEWVKGWKPNPKKFIEIVKLQSCYSVSQTTEDGIKHTEFRVTLEECLDYFNLSCSSLVMPVDGGWILYPIEIGDFSCFSLPSLLQYA